MYYVIPFDTRIEDCCEHSTHPRAKSFHTFEMAKEYANNLHEKFNNHWRIAEVNYTWTTKTLADLLAEDPAHRAMIRR